jgi:intron-binding protein aquarius
MPASDGLTVDGVAKLTVPALKAALQARNLPATGLKAELAKRLVEALGQESQAAGAAEPAPAAEAEPAAAPAPPPAAASPAKPSVQPAAAPEPAPVAEPAPAAAPAPPAQQSPVRLASLAPRMRNPNAAPLALQAPKRKAAPEAVVPEPAAPPEKRQAVPEAVAPKVAAPPEKRAAVPAAEPVARKAAPSAAAGVPTLRELQTDRLTAVADANWRLPEGKPRPALDNKVVEKVYADELGGGARAPAAQRASVLEISQVRVLRRASTLLRSIPDTGPAVPGAVPLAALRRPGCERDARAVYSAHGERKVPRECRGMGVLHRRRQVCELLQAVRGACSLAPAPCAHLHVHRSVLSLKSERELTVPERTAYLVFMINVFQSLENELIRTVALPLVSLPLWHALSPGRLQVRLGSTRRPVYCADAFSASQLELAQHPQLDKHWRHQQRKDAKAAKQPGYVPMAQQPAAVFLPGLVDEFLATLQAVVTSGGEVDAQRLAYCERFTEFLIDMLSQLPTRRFVRTMLEDRAVLVKCRLSALFSNPRGRLFSQLVDLFRFYQGFEINDHTGTQLTDDEFAAAHYDRLQQLQRLAFKHIPALRELALSNCGSIEKRQALTRHLQALPAADLARLATQQLRLVSPEDPWASDPRFLMEVVVSAFEKRRSQRQAIAEMPLYPNEEVLWDENVVPSIAYTGEGCLALPKLNLQFLTFHDYLLRNFNLFRLEATYEIREDLGDVLKRVGPVPHPEAPGRVLFTGWARMAVPPVSFAIREVRKPNVGEAKPSAVTAEIKFDLASLRPPVRAEWDELRQHDVLFLLVRVARLACPQLCQKRSPLCVCRASRLPAPRAHQRCAAALHACAAAAFDAARFRCSPLQSGPACSTCVAAR